MNPRTFRASAARCVVVACLSLAGCSRRDPAAPPAAPEAAQAPSNRIPLPDAVRRNLGVTFAKAERRAVAATVRYPGRFEAAHGARRTYAAPAAGRVVEAAEPFRAVRRGDVVARVRTPRLLELRRELAAAEADAAQARAQLEGLPAYLAAHEAHEAALKTTVEAWRERLAQVESLRRAGAGTNDEAAAARAALATAESELAETLEKDADLEVRARELRSRVDGAAAQADLLRREISALSQGYAAGSAASTGGTQTRPRDDAASDVVVLEAAADGVVEATERAAGAWVEAGDPIVVVLDPAQVRFRAAIPQGDVFRIADGARARLVPPAGGPASAALAPVDARLRLALAARAEDRTLDVFAEPAAAPASWMRPGASGVLEVAPEGVETEVAVPRAAVLRDGLKAVLFRRDPKDPDVAIRIDADVGADDGRWIALRSGVRDGDEVVVGGAYQLLLATSSAPAKGGHFHADGTFHADDHK
ncbi:MAG TPA: HlyD family efflux transporter periplasmic adaptor subunit [Planctomycetota bacterium]|nr:HlyD family efflux transporter periplasmic adaptor subunit [Planctomycetota bacterium]